MSNINDYGVTDNGFKYMSLEDAQSVIVDELKEGDNQLDLTDNSANSVIFNSVANVMTTNNQQEGKVLDNGNILYASGTHLDGLAMQVGITRKIAENSWCYMSITGDIGTVIQLGTIAINRQGDNFTNLEVAVIDVNSNNCTSAVITIPEALEDVDYTITIRDSNVQNHSVSYHSSTGDTISDILNGFYNALNQDTIFTTITDIVKDDENNTITITSKTQPLNPFSLEINENLLINKATISIVFIAVSTGALNVNAGALSLKDNISGVDFATNLQNGIIGRDVESDSELRRDVVNRPIVSSKTAEAIESALKDTNKIQGVTYAKVVNTVIGTKIINEQTYYIVAIEAIVFGGDNNDVAQVIFDTQAEPAYTTGNTTGIAIDDNEIQHNILFTRPVNKYIWVNVELEEESEGSLPLNYTDIVKTSIMKYADTLNIGDDVNIAYLSNYIISDLIGLKNIYIELAVTNNASDTPTYVTSGINIAAKEIAIFSDIRINVSLQQ